MNIMKAIAGIMMLILGTFLVVFTLMINSGHTSSRLDLSEDILYGFGGLILMVAGVYALRTAGK